jgi:hypothetical protein
MSIGFNAKRKKIHQHQLDGMENFLSDAFAPVAPSSDFVSHLGKRLTSYPNPLPEAPSTPAQIWRYTFLALFSVLGGGLLLALLIRYFINIVNALSPLRQSRGGAKTEPAAFS